jgi:hypothetical protein
LKPAWDRCARRKALGPLSNYTNQEFQLTFQANESYSRSCFFPMQKLKTISTAPFLGLYSVSC